MTTVEPLTPLFGLPETVCEHARDLTIERIPIVDAVRCNALWHSQLPEAKGLQFGDLQQAFAATFDCGIYGVAIWTRPIAANRMAHDSSHLLELRRLAIPNYAPKFTATRMLGQMRRHIKREIPEVCRLLSYQVTDVHTGTIYRAANWHVARRQSEYEEWSGHTKRPGVDDQNVSPKVRWELQIRKCVR